MSIGAEQEAKKRVGRLRIELQTLCGSCYYHSCDCPCDDCKLRDEKLGELENLMPIAYPEDEDE